MTTKKLKDIIENELSDANYFSLALYVMGSGLTRQMADSINDYIDSTASKTELERLKELVQSYLDNQCLVDEGNN